MSERVGVRELRQNLSKYLRRVEAGESLDVTERGRPVARLVPLVEGGLLAKLAREGRLMQAPRGRLEDLGPPPAGGPSISEALQAGREDRI
jgi:prevent-host-death family protein